MIELDGPIRGYAWGSRSFLAGLQGRPVPSEGPEAELWLGAHPQAPSLAGGRPLSELVAEAPEAVLGRPVLERFGPRLPYLLKLLAADQPLSIQVHPDPEQARDGFGARAGYTDPYPKPELLVALTDFDALCGFRDPAQTAQELAGLTVAALAPVIEALRDPDAGSALRRTLALLLGWPEHERSDLVTAVAASGHPLAVRLATCFPGDLGVVVAFLLNHVRLQPGQAIWMPAGNVHAYLSGAGVEIMGASDNVLRAGLTVKPVDPVELMRVVRYEVLDEPCWPGSAAGAGLTVWQPPAPEFRLVRADAPAALPGDGPRVVVCVRGRAALRAGNGAVTLTPGRAVLLTAEEPAAEITGEATVFQASPGQLIG